MFKHKGTFCLTMNHQWITLLLFASIYSIFFFTDLKFLYFHLTLLLIKLFAHVSGWLWALLLLRDLKIVVHHIILFLLQMCLFNSCGDSKISLIWNSIAINWDQLENDYIFIQNNIAYIYFNRRMVKEDYQT